MIGSNLNIKKLYIISFMKANILKKKRKIKKKKKVKNISVESTKDI